MHTSTERLCVVFCNGAARRRQRKVLITMMFFWRKFSFLARGNLANMERSKIIKKNRNKILDGLTC
jgi:hypothetical protein